jgi:hypothetical protein
MTTSLYRPVTDQVPIGDRSGYRTGTDRVPNWYRTGTELLLLCCWPATQTAAQTATQTAAQTATQTATQTAAQTATQTAAQTATQTAAQTAAQTGTGLFHDRYKIVTDLVPTLFHITSCCSAHLALIPT